jgi:hypothetical protein
MLTFEALEDMHYIIMGKIVQKPFPEYCIFLDF